MHEIYYEPYWFSTITSSTILSMDANGVWGVIEFTSAADDAAIDDITEIL